MKHYFSSLLLLIGVCSIANAQNVLLSNDTNASPVVNDYLYVQPNGSGVYSRAFGLNGSNELYIGSVEHTISNIYFFNKGTGILGTFMPSGNFGLGTTTPKSKLDLGTNYSDPSTYPNKITLWSGGDNNYYGFGISSGDLDYFSQSNHRFYTGYNGTPGVERMVITGAGNVGIGANAPKQKLEVNGSVKMGGHYENVITFNGLGTPTNGYKIKTNIPFATGVGMYNIDIHGYHYGNKSPIGLDLTFYVWAPAGTPPNFINQKISSSGDWTPDVKLAVENGKIVIIIPEPGYYVRFGVSAFAPWNSSQDDDYFNGWVVADEAVVAGTTDITDVIYENSFGTVTIKDTYSLNVKDTGGTERRTLFNQTAANNTLYLGHIDANWGSNLRLRSGLGMVFSVNNSTGNLSEAMRINTDGGVAVGTTTTGTHKLAVEGSVGAREVMVEAPGTGWSDFVFESDYNLPTLKEVEQHIQEKGHLKDIPSAAQVEENGFYLGEMDSKLLQKIEELTLYTIDQEKKIKDLKNQVEELKVVNDKLLKFQQRLEKLEQNQNK